MGDRPGPGRAPADGGTGRGGHGGTAPRPAPTLVFVTQRGACECRAVPCVAGEQEVLGFLALNPWGFRRETVDLKDNPQEAKALGVRTVPVVFLLDGRGQRVARFEGFFAEADFHRA